MTHFTDKIAVGIVAAFALLAGMYSVVNPIFESSDELSHFPVVEHIATTGALPVQDPAIETLWEQEGSQPPLYYLVTAGVVTWFDTSDLEGVRDRNPHAKIGVPDDFDNKNMIIHTPAEAFPWSGTILAIHMTRFVSVIFTTVGVGLGYLLAREVFPERRWLAVLATALTAFNPMFLFIAGSVNNDNLTMPLATLVLLLSVRIMRHGVTTRRAVILAVAFALLSITKVSGVTFAAFMGVALLVHGWQTGHWKESFNTGFIITGAWLVLALWWYIRNIVLYGELTGTAMHVEIVGARPPIGLFELLRTEWYSFWVAYWSWFGGVNVLSADWVYVVFAVITITSIVGSVVWFINKIRWAEWRDMLLPGAIVLQLVLIMAALLHWTLTTYASQGRLIFPIIAGVNILCALGLTWWLPERVRPWMVAGAALPLLVISSITPYAYILPAYEQPPTVESVPADAYEMNITYGPLELVAVDRNEPLPTLCEGDYVPVTVYWRLTEPTETEYSTAYALLSEFDALVGKIDSYPGGGTLPTTQMEPGVIYKDSYRVPLTDDISARMEVLLAVDVGLYDGVTYTFVRPEQDRPLVPVANAVPGPCE